ncbi:MAG: 4a-hydroxytetrahydrobiopterin dehydratase [Phycisphaerales bacterium]
MQTLRNKIFINHRWDDTKSDASMLADHLSANFQSGVVFLDHEAVQYGDQLSSTILSELKRARVMLVLIGPRWYGKGPHSTRRIDDPKDWVRREIEYALEHKQDVLTVPVLVGIDSAKIAKLLAPSARLPKPLDRLDDCARAVFRPNAWRSDVTDIIKRLADPTLGLARVSTQVIYPPPMDNVQPLGAQELASASSTLDGWSIVRGENAEHPEATELKKNFMFTTFQEALHFMIVAARWIDIKDHHPRWQNVWRNVTVWLTGWDIRFRPSYKDIELAKYLDELYVDYAPPVNLPVQTVLRRKQRT